jgi:phenylpyruvate tautomerase PptA (4-oxalocrotonate tautomerase family)/ketosteroid isomerase-like protein
MPIIRGTLIRGYAADVRRRLAERLTDAVAATLQAPLDAITVVFEEVDADSYMRGRTPRSPGAALRPASDIVLDFLRLMEARDLDGARVHLSPDFEMVFPGPRNGTRMSSLEELVAFSAPRYRFVRKTVDSVNESHAGTTTTIFVSGTLHGEQPDGTPFANVRFIDRFEVEDGKIRRQEVWNDLATALRQASD